MKASKDIKKMLSSLSPEELILVREYVQGPECQKKMDEFRGQWEPIEAPVAKKKPAEDEEVEEDDFEEDTDISAEEEA